MTDQVNRPKGVTSVALIAHDNKKADLIAWVEKNSVKLNKCTVYATGTTGKLIAEKTGVDVKRCHSGPLGGDQQIGALISEGKVDLLIFFWDPLEPMPHDPDIKALLRLATLWNVPSACNSATADFLVNSNLFEEFLPQRPDFDSYLSRDVPGN
ncbi:methylglyoxal synthase [Hahella chejuensis KCTC 2396]|uniref:Methylglyoxal synthase n=1 Tax=Hahella chejuensis (strain KCTC 2396) TaxID=349521 RepID=MGSA_HAHCH|nr:methylglyoxal synthase [Hahella chejuensis]Q2SK75.1 RecName: Full=Methylglyoxal synthase; Short=MGS [Hahella chejuensis KCTC 2396]ABC28949.1 methylglyoxal synthase [Hahella chejuensis KCTC 2396]